MAAAPTRVPEAEVRPAKRPKLLSGRVGFESAAGMSARAESGMLPGPGTVRDVFRWPSIVMSSLFQDPARECRLKSWMMMGIGVYSDYSGIASEIEALRCVWEDMRARAGWGGVQFPWKFHRVCDISPSCIHVLKQISLQQFSGQMCVFKDLRLSMAPHSQKWMHAKLKELNTTEEATPREARDRAMATYDDLSKHLLRNGKSTWPLDRKRECEVHPGSSCPIHPSSRTYEEKNDDAWDTLHPDPMYIHFAGVTCDGWSTIGSQERFAHGSEATHSCYLGERKQFGDAGVEHIAFVECTPNHPVLEKISTPLAGSHKTVFVTVGPEHLGYPVHRKRVFAAAINLKLCRWLGPDDPQDEFERLFFRTINATGEVFMSASPAERASELSKLAKIQGNYISPDTIRTTPLSQLLPVVLNPSQLKHYRSYCHARSALESYDGSMLCDLEHNPGQRSRAGHLWPCQLSHGLVCSVPRDAEPSIAVALEHLAAHGYHIYPSATEDFPTSPMLPILQDLSRGQIVELSGRAVHLAVLSSWMMYVLSHVGRIPQTSGIIKASSGLWMSNDEQDSQQHDSDSDDAEKQTSSTDIVE